MLTMPARHGAATNQLLSMLPALLSLTLGLTTLAPGVLAQQDGSRDNADAQQLIGAVKSLERRLGFRRTHNFSRHSEQAAAEYRCYYTGKLELPDSYEGLGLVQGNSMGCPLDQNKYDVFFYPIEAVANGKTPVTTSLENASAERLLVVVPHEDFHGSKELQKLPANLSEAASTLVGFLTAGEVGREKFGPDSDVYKHLAKEPELFLQKADIINRYHATIGRLYASVQSGTITREAAAEQKEQLFTKMRIECNAMDPTPRSFNKCPAVSNNAGLAFDATYTKYYPLLYRFYRSCQAKGWDLKTTADALKNALARHSETEAVQRVETLITNPKSQASR
jgi:hypothetical protein